MPHRRTRMRRASIVLIPLSVVTLPALCVSFAACGGASVRVSTEMQRMRHEQAERVLRRTRNAYLAAVIDGIEPRFINPQD